MKEKRPPAGAATAFAIEDLGFETVGYINREPRRIAEALDARGLSGDHELADLFRNFGDILPNQLQRMTIAIAAIEKGGLL